MTEEFVMRNQSAYQHSQLAVEAAVEGRDPLPHNVDALIAWFDSGLMGVDDKLRAMDTIEHLLLHVHYL